MSTNVPFKMDVSESFPHLSNAPIAEAIIGINARPTQALEEGSLSTLLDAKLPDYPTKEATKSLHYEINFVKPNAGQTALEGWHGIRCISQDGKQVAQFNRDGFFLSRLPPYQDWARLTAEMLRLWKIYCEVTRPLEVIRLGVRFVNRIMLPMPGSKLSEILTHPPQSAIGMALPMIGFLHQDSFTVPDTDLVLQVIKTIQPMQGADIKGFALILDIDAFTTKPFELKNGVLEKRLEQMTWLKNKAFFGSLKQKIVDTFK